MGLQPLRRLKALYNQNFRREQYEAALKELNLRPGEMNAVLEHPDVAILAGEIGRLFLKAGGINFVEFSVLDKATMRHFMVTVQDLARPKPSQIIAQMRETLEAIAADPHNAQEKAIEQLRKLGYSE